MDERSALLRAVCAHPEEDTPRLVFADWLDEHAADGREGRDDRDRARYIRCAIKFARSELKAFRCERTRTSVLVTGGLSGRVFEPRARCRCKVCNETRTFNQIEARNVPVWRSEATDRLCHIITSSWTPEEIEFFRNPPLSAGGLDQFRAAREWRSMVGRYWPRVEMRRGFAEIMHVSTALFVRFAGAFFAGMPVTAVHLTDLQIRPNAGDDTVSCANLPEALHPWIREHSWADTATAELCCSEGCVTYGRAERDRFWAAERAAA